MNKYRQMEKANLMSVIAFLLLNLAAVDDDQSSAWRSRASEQANYSACSGSTLIWRVAGCESSRAAANRVKDQSQ